MLLSQLVGEFIIAKRAQRLSVHTISDYSLTLKRFQNFIGDVNVDAISFQDVASFLASFDVSKKTVLNYWVALASMWSYAVKQKIVVENIVYRVVPPKPEKREVIPFSSSEFFLLLSACQSGKNSLRDYAILLVLLDTGVRASELCSLRVRDYSGYSILVFGKGSKERELPLSKKSLEALDFYLSSRNVVDRDFLFVSGSGFSFGRHALRLMLVRLGKRAGVRKVYAHKFRHTFSITFLRGGGNVYALQKILGHTTLEMCLRYLAVSRSDIFEAHRSASPVMLFTAPRP